MRLCNFILRKHIFKNRNTMKSTFKQRLKGRLVVNNTLDEPCSPPQKSSFNLSEELNQHECNDISASTSVIASQDFRRSMLNDTEICFNPPAYSTICHFSDSSPEQLHLPPSGSSPLNVSETDSEDLTADSLYVTTLEPTVNKVDETRDVSMDDVINGLSGMNLGAKILKQRRAQAAAALLSSDSEEDEVSLPSSALRSSRQEELSQRLNNILSTCKKKRTVRCTKMSGDCVPETDSERSLVRSASSQQCIPDSDDINRVPDTDSYQKNETCDSGSQNVIEDSEEQSLQTNDVCLQVSLGSEDSEEGGEEEAGEEERGEEEGAEEDGGEEEELSMRNVSLQVSLTDDCGLSDEMHTPPSFSRSESEIVEDNIESDHNNNCKSDGENNSFDIGAIKAAFKKLTFSDSEDSEKETATAATARRKAHLQTLMWDEDEDPQLPPSLPSLPASTCVISDSSSDDEFENYIQLQKKKVKKLAAKSPQSLKSFIVDDLSSDEENDPVFYAQTNNVITSQRRKTPSVFKTPINQHVIIENECGSLTKVTKTPSVRKKHPSTPRPLALPDITNIGSPQRTTPKKVSFLGSLSSNVSDIQRHPDAIKYLKKFSTVREELTARLFKLFNETVFDKQLPENMEVNWNVRLTKTAGFCTYKKQMPTATGRWAKIELSVKVCDSAERLRDTMIHEMCHAAVWLIHGQNDHHGPLWQLYARKSNRIHEDLTTISRCHTYEIQTKYTYKCNKCGYEIGRHSKSLDIEKKVCGYCRGTFEVFINTPRRTPKRAATNRTPNPFAQFVKDNYATLKRENPSLIHKDIMKKLSENFKK